ncbi:hypothetical protein FOA52_003737 [Chlamydomonas sp. UWO 241]|nr:hypothetical protein FOA52_002842 [Chlamydomonas sp. UWO 241]KAG1657500.1 hypothetical protein FOA52_003737 [Chlamydomonas sp. UWO 241]
MYVPKTLATIIAEKAGVDVEVALNVMETMCLHIIDCVKEDKEVAFTNFLKFKRSTRKARTFLPPKATKEVEIGERFAMTVKVMPKMKLILNPEDEALITKASKKPVAKKSENSKSDSDKAEKSDKSKTSDDEMVDQEVESKAAPKKVKAVKAAKAAKKAEPEPVREYDSDEETEKENEDSSDSDEDDVVVPVPVAKKAVKAKAAPMTYRRTGAPSGWTLAERGTRAPLG